MERGRSLSICKVKGHISRSLDGYLGNFIWFKSNCWFKLKIYMSGVCCYTQCWSCLIFLFVFYVPSTVRSFRDGSPIYCPLRRTWSSVNTLFPSGIEPRAVAWQSIKLLLRHASSTFFLIQFLKYVCSFDERAFKKFALEISIFPKWCHSEFIILHTRNFVFLGSI